MIVQGFGLIWNIYFDYVHTLSCLTDQGLDKIKSMSNIACISITQASNLEPYIQTVSLFLWKYFWKRKINKSNKNVIYKKKKFQQVALNLIPSKLFSLYCFDFPCFATMLMVNLLSWCYCWWFLLNFFLDLISVW